MSTPSGLSESSSLEASDGQIGTWRSHAIGDGRITATGEVSRMPAAMGWLRRNTSLLSSVRYYTTKCQALGAGSTGSVGQPVGSRGQSDRTTGLIENSDSDGLARFPDFTSPHRVEETQATKARYRFSS
ncbi:unnamed protein product [Protopolystoma xenopodis]|uniref:Uncharacterized protein n=1 Tax=Protopolystoma xenopodis TaxID=117903 RepID=A0A448X7C0_9PLAT|nr:unnamed protein product [Protopolystoma xenopodis]